MTYSLFDFLQLVGSLGIFIYGMKVFSDGLQKVAGGRLRSILKGMTTTRFKGILTGFGATTITQSSTTTTVMDNPILYNYNRNGCQFCQCRTHHIC